MNAPEMLIQGDERCGEAPTWDNTTDQVMWVDQEESLVFASKTDKPERKVISSGLAVAGIARNSDRRWVFAGPGGVHLWAGQGDYTTLISEYEGEALCFNDIIAGPGGHLYGGTMYWGPDGMIKTGKLYIYRSDGTMEILDDDIKLSNGLGFSPDAGTLYYADSAARCIFAYDIEQQTGLANNKRTFVEVPREAGIPDGLTVDASGCLWCAHWYGGQVVRYDPDGSQMERILLPVKQVSSVIFGGPDLTDLYVTTAGEYWPSDLIPEGFDAQGLMGGALFRIRSAGQGRPEYITDLRV